MQILLFYFGGASSRCEEPTRRAPLHENQFHKKPPAGYKKEREATNKSIAEVAWRQRLGGGMTQTMTRMAAARETYAK